MKAKIFTLDTFTHSNATTATPCLSPPIPHCLCSHNFPADYIIIPQVTMTWNIRLFIFYMIYNFFKYDDFKILRIKYLSYSMVVISLPYLLQSQSYTKVIPDKELP